MFGAWLALFMHFVVREPLFQHVNFLLFTHDPHSSKNFKQYAVVSVISGVIVFSIMISLYIIVNNTFEIPAEWYQNLASKCGTETINLSFANAGLVESGGVAIANGAYFGILY
mmetsp:Transcript_29608/g.22012  ORF Transcript_29608/g.22012 Transcript_29608/m.22012 type:complete len:113 (+) Transcript_29608:82-420(+)